MRAKPADDSVPVISRASMIRSTTGCDE
jgi:hypothetical protein